jgi:multidrug resistance efflux pump
MQIHGKGFFPALIYAFLGLLLFFLLTLTFNSHVLLLKVESGLVNVPIETIQAPTHGIIDEIYAKEGDRVAKNGLLVTINNVELTRELELARLQVADAKLMVDYYQTLLATELQKQRIYRLIGTSRLTSANASYAVSLQEMLIAKDNIKRMQALHDQHFVSDANWQLLNARYKQSQLKLQDVKAQKALEYHSLNSLDYGIYFTGNKLEGKAQDIKAELNAAHERWLINEKKLAIYETSMKALQIKAPFAGKVIHILKSSGNSIDNSKPIMLLEQSSINKNIIAFLTQNEVLHIRLNDKVKIYIPGLDKTFIGNVTEINRTQGLIDDNNGQYLWRDLYTDRSALAKITIDGKTNDAFNRQTYAGMPAIIYFRRRTTMF